MVNVVVTGVPVSNHTQCLQMAGGMVNVGCVCDTISARTGLPSDSFMLVADGRIACREDTVVSGLDDAVFFELRVRRVLPGGKGGFGAMLRGANASKKTTNFSACRDLQGRRLRDVEAMRAQSQHTAPAPPSAPEPMDASAAGSSSDAVVAAPVDVDLEVAKTAEVVDGEMAVVAEDVEDAVSQGLMAARAARAARKKKGTKRRGALAEGQVAFPGAGGKRQKL